MKKENKKHPAYKKAGTADIKKRLYREHIRKKFVERPDEGMVVCFGQPLWSAYDEAQETDNEMLIKAVYNAELSERERTDFCGVARCDRRKDQYRSSIGRGIAAARTDCKLHKDIAADFREAARELEKALRLAERAAELHERKAAGLRAAAERLGNQED